MHKSPFFLIKSLMVGLSLIGICNFYTANSALFQEKEPSWHLFEVSSFHDIPQRKSFLNINLASEQELTQLPGVGKVLAGRIVEYRTKHGRFRSKDELLEVKGIGPKKLKKVKDLISL